MLDNLFISDAIAQGTAAAGSEVSLASFMPLIIIFAIFYLLIIRPQSKKYKLHQEMVEGLKIGNKVTTTGGIIGVIREVDKKEGIFEVEIAEGIQIKILKNHVSELVKEEKKESKASAKAKKSKKKS